MTVSGPGTNFTVSSSSPPVDNDTPSPDPSLDPYAS